MWLGPACCLSPQAKPNHSRRGIGSTSPTHTKNWNSPHSVKYCTEQLCGTCVWGRTSASQGTGIARQCDLCRLADGGDYNVNPQTHGRAKEMTGPTPALKDSCERKVYTLFTSSPCIRCKTEMNKPDLRINNSLWTEQWDSNSCSFLGQHASLAWDLKSKTAERGIVWWRSSLQSGILNKTSFSWQKTKKNRQNK